MPRSAVAPLCLATKGGTTLGGTQEVEQSSLSVLESIFFEESRMDRLAL